MKKNIVVGGFTKAQREKELEKVKAKHEKKGYKFVEYIDNGSLKSIAIFEVDEAILKKEKSQKLIRTGALFLILAAVLYISSGESSSTTTQKDISNKKARELSLTSLKKISNSFVLEKQLDPTKYNEKFYNCLGQKIWEKSDDLTVSTMLDWCYIDYEKSTNHLMPKYFNSAELLSNFSPWDGSYRPLEKLIKANMHDPDSYEHVSTQKSFVYYGTNTPHMNVIMKFRGKNQLGGTVINQVTAKVNASTYTLYDIK